MQKVILRMNEQQKYEIIKNLISKSGNKRIASIKLNCSLRTINRLIIKFKNKGKIGFIHGNRNSKNRTKNEEVKQKIINYYQQHQYNESNFKHFKELLKNNHNINFPYTFIYQTLAKVEILSPKCQRVTKRNKLKNERQNIKMKKELIKIEKNEIQNSENITIPSRIIPNSLAHPRKPRAKYFGELIQMDASQHKWFNNEINHLHLAVDDATSKILGAYFIKEETFY